MNAETTPTPSQELATIIADAVAAAVRKELASAPPALPAKATTVDVTPKGTETPKPTSKGPSEPTDEQAAEYSLAEAMATGNQALVRAVRRVRGL